jgi:hypothetical protein
MQSADELHNTTPAFLHHHDEDFRDAIRGCLHEFEDGSVYDCEENAALSASEIANLKRESPEQG